MHACLLTCQVTVAPQIQLSIERSLASKPACYSFKNISTKDWIINAGSSEWRQENIFFNDFVADEILVLLIPLSNIQGSYSSSCLTAKPHNIKDLFLAVCSEYACARARAKARACVRMSVCVLLLSVTYHLSPVTCHQVDNERWPRLAMEPDWTSSSDFLRAYAELWNGQIDNWMDLGSVVVHRVHMVNLEGRFRDLTLSLTFIGR